MSRLLLASTPAQGHTAPLLVVARHLVDRGHEVVFLTTAHYARRVADTGAQFVALSPEGDAHDLLVSNPEREAASRRGLRGVKDDLRRVFIDPARHQYHDVREILSNFPADAVIADTTFVGIAPLMVGRQAGRRRGDRPAVIVLGVLPLPISSRDTAPFGLALPPLGGLLGQVRNVGLTWLARHVALRDVQRHAQEMLRAEGCPPVEKFVVDAPAHLADAYLQLTTESFEYPRRDLPPAVRFLGPILPDPSLTFHEPPWWGDLDQSRPVVHVTQGTLDNHDLTRLVLPTIEGLSRDDLLVVGTTGGPDPDSLPIRLPANARIEGFIPHDRLLAKVDVMVTNGGYGGVQQALALGVPLVVAGDSEDKPEVAARVAWSGTGVNLRSGRPSPGRVAAAVRHVLADPSFGAHAQAMRREIRAHRPLDELDEVLDALGVGAPA